MIKQTGLLALFALLSLLVLASAEIDESSTVATAPKATLVDGNTLVMPYTEGASEIRELQVFRTPWMSLWTLEFDPYLEIKVTVYDETTVGFTIHRNPTRTTVANDEYFELCINGTSTTNSIPTTEKTMFCIGDSIYSGRLKYDQETMLTFSEPPKRFEWYVGEGGGGGGGIGCTPGWSVLELETSASSPQNTETGFSHSADFVIEQGDAGGSCPVTFQHKTGTSYVAYSTSYPSVDKSVARISSGNTTNPIEVTGTGSLSKTITCGVKHGTLELRVTAGELTAYNNVTCNDNIAPNISIVQPANATITTDSLISFTCNASDNTGLSAMELWMNATGTWSLNGSTTYGLLTYNATTTFNRTLNPGSYVWACKAKDTRTPTNDVFSTNYTSYVNEPDVTNETLAREAVQEAIQAMIPESATYSDQKIYKIESMWTQQQGRFDIVAVEGNQTWVFNYLTNDEALTNMTNLSTVLYVLEMQQLTYNEIEQTVQDFINNTKE